MSEETVSHTTLRWGGSQVFPIPITTGESLNLPTKQLLSLHWKWPISWNVYLVFVPLFNATENATFTINVEYVIGVGQGIDSFVRQFNIAPTAGVYPVSVVDQEFVPAQDLQLTAQLIASPSTTVAEQLKIAAWAAPQTEPHAMRYMLELFEKMSTGQGGQEVQWMGPGFEPVPLGYRR